LIVVIDASRNIIRGRREPFETIVNRSLLETRTGRWPRSLTHFHHGSFHLFRRRHISSHDYHAGGHGCRHHSSLFFAVPLWGVG
jgi:hypothetical protein